MLEKFSPSALFALNRLGENGFEAFLIGGSVRDALMGLPLGDIDITTNALPHDVERVFTDFKSVETGIKHGTVTVIVNGEPIEITTYRTESGYSDNRRPDFVSFSQSFSGDVLRRDFTMNAIGISKDGEIRDEVGGMADIENKLVRAIGSAEERFSEDALRILRAVRFASVLDFEIEEDTKRAVHEKRELLKNISAERKRDELLKLINGDNAEKILLEYSDVLASCIPEIECEIGFSQHNRHHVFDVYTHSVKALAKARKDANIRMALLLHDIGKPYTAKFDEKGEMHFKCHAQKSFEISEKILSGLRFSNADKNEILTLIKYHDIPFMCEDMKNPSKKRIKRIVSKFGKDTALKLAEVRRCDNAAQNPDYFLGEDFYDSVCKMISETSDSGECIGLKDLAVNGNDLLALGFSGREIGDTLDALLDKVLDEDLSNYREVLLDFVKKIKRDL